MDPDGVLDKSILSLETSYLCKIPIKIKKYPHYKIQSNAGFPLLNLYAVILGVNSNADTKYCVACFIPSYIEYSLLIWFSGYLGND